jgi:tetratricopeptide (TPR) repeat protein
MLQQVSRRWWLILLAASFTASPALAAEEKGRADLDKATEAKVAANSSGSIDDLNDVVRLAESALTKGLDATGTEFAKRLLASAYLQRGQAKTRQLFSGRSSPDDLRKQRELAVSDIEKSLKLEQKQPQAHLCLAQLNLLIMAYGDNLNDVISSLDKAIELGADDPPTKAKALTFRAELQQEPKKKLADLDAAIQLLPDEPDAYEIKALVLAQMKKYDEALAALNKARSLDPKSLSIIVQQAKVHMVQGKLDAALDDMNQAFAVAPNNTGLLILRAAIYQEKGDKAKALADIDKAVELKPDDPTVLRSHAMFLAQGDRLPEAIAELEKLAQRNPKDISTLLELAIYLGAAKNSLKAIEVYQSILALTPDDWQAMRGLADSLLNVGRQTEALALYEKVIKIEPKDEGILNNFAWLLCTSPDDKIRDGRRAVELATEACKLTEYKAPHVLSTLAAAYAETGDFDSAVKWITKGLEIAEKMKPTEKDGDKETIDALKKELDSYKAKKPTRELLSEDKAEPKKP